MTGKDDEQPLWQEALTTQLTTQMKELSEQVQSLVSRQSSKEAVEQSALTVPSNGVVEYLLEQNRNLQEQLNGLAQRNSGTGGQDAPSTGQRAQEREPQAGNNNGADDQSQRTPTQKKEGFLTRPVVFGRRSQRDQGSS